MSAGLSLLWYTYGLNLRWSQNISEKVKVSPAKFIKPRENTFTEYFVQEMRNYAQRTKTRFYSIHFNSTYINEYLVCGSSMLGAAVMKMIMHNSGD